MSVSLTSPRIRAIVLDVEGTTTPIAFVYDILFPFARAHAEAFVTAHREAPACRAAFATLERERASDAARGDTPPAALLDYVRWLMDRDRKSPGLKALQGLIWQEGFDRGELRGQVYADVPPAFERWRALGLEIYIYSSGSVLAQRLLFGSTSFGDLTAHLNGHFDTGVGPKGAAESYIAIAEQIDVAPPEILFVSDVVAELDAAREAGFRTALCVRDAAPPDPAGHPVVRTFEEIAAEP